MLHSYPVIQSPVNVKRSYGNNELLNSKYKLITSHDACTGHQEEKWFSVMEDSKKWMLIKDVVRLCQRQTEPTIE